MFIFKEGNQDALYDFYYKRNRIQQIRGFITVVQNKTFAKASEVLRISQSSVFSQVKSLENKLGIRLFKKQGRNVVLTEEGKGFYEKSLPILNSIDNLYEDFIDNDINGYNKVFKIAGHHIFLTKILPKSVGDLFHSNPRFKFEINAEIKNDALEQLLNGQIDIAFYACDKKDERDYQDLKFVKLVEYKMCAVFGKEFNLMQEMVNGLYDNFPNFNSIILKKHIVSNQVTKRLHSTKYNDNLIINTDNYDIAKELAKQNIGAYFFDERYLTDEDRKELNTLYLQRNATFDLHYYAITKKDVQMKEGIKSLLKNVENHCKPSTP